MQTGGPRLGPPDGARVRRAGRRPGVRVAGGGGTAGAGASTSHRGAR